MQLVPTRSAYHLTVIGASLMMVGIVAVRAEASLLGAALILAVAWARALAKWGALRSRMSGFEMVWDERRRLIPVVRGSSVELSAILTNRDDRALEFSELELIHAPGLRAEVLPRAATIPKGASVRVVIRLDPRSAGPLGVFGLSVQMTRPPGLFATPLVFSNPLVVLVAPDGSNPRFDGRERELGGSKARRSFLAQDALEFRELREHRPGDPFRRIAWKPSARRGKLLVMETEEHFDAHTWILFDASRELFLGSPSPHDRALDYVACLARRRLEQGQRVGFSAFGSRELVRISPEPGRRQWLRIRGALTEDLHTADADRSALGLLELEELVLEHAQSLDPTIREKWRRGEPERNELLASLIKNAPFVCKALLGSSEQERLLRRYLRSFGIESPPALEPERMASERRLAAILGEKDFRAGGSGEVMIVGRLPDAQGSKELWSALERMTRRGRRVCFHVVSELGAPTPRLERGAEARSLFQQAVRARLAATSLAARRRLARGQVRVVPLTPQLSPRE